MLFYTLSECKSISYQVISRYSPVNFLIISLFVSPFLVALICEGLEKKSAPLWMFLSIFIVVLTLILGGTISDIIKSLRADSWLLALTSDALLVKYRHLANAYYSAEDKQILCLPFAEIESVRPVKQILDTCDSRGRESKEVTTYLEINLRANDCGQLQGMLKKERQNIVGKTKIGCYSSNSPVKVVLENQIWVSIDNVRGNARKVAGKLAGKVSVLELVTLSERITSDLSPAELDEKIRRLVDFGNSTTAIALVRSAYNVGIKEAKDYIEELKKSAELKVEP